MILHGQNVSTINYFSMTDSKKIKKFSVAGEDVYSFDTKDYNIIKPDHYIGEFSIIEKDGSFTVKMNNRQYNGTLVELKQNKCTVLINENTYVFTIDTDFSLKRKQKLKAEKIISNETQICSPMPGKIVDIFVSEGQEVTKGVPVMILEAMKMQNQIVAHMDGKVKSISVKVDDSVFADQVLLDIEEV